MGSGNFILGKMCHEGKMRNTGVMFPALIPFYIVYQSKKYSRVCWKALCIVTHVCKLCSIYSPIFLLNQQNVIDKIMTLYLLCYQ